MTAILDRYARALALSGQHRRHEAISALDEALEGQPTTTDPAVRAGFLGERIALELAVHPGASVTAWVEELRRLDEWRAGLEETWRDYYYQEPMSVARAMAALLESRATRTPRERARAALLAGKLASDAEELALARSWLLEAVREARACMDRDLVAAAYGALAEVFYLAGYTLIALELIALDAALLPPGSSDAQRLMVYRSHAYRQLSEWAVARCLCEEALQALRAMQSELALNEIGTDRVPSRAACYPLRSLVWTATLELARDSGSLAARRDVRVLGERIEAAGEPHSTAHSLLSRAWLARTAQNNEDWSGLVARARSVFSSAGYKAEARWCDAVLGSLRPVETRLEFPVRPLTSDICDAWMEQLMVPDLGTRRAASMDSFGTSGVEAGLSWMGVFF